MDRIDPIAVAVGLAFLGLLVLGALLMFGGMMMMGDKFDNRPLGRLRRLPRNPPLPFVLGYAAAWFFLNLGRMQPYIPGATMDPTFAPPQAVRGLSCREC